MARRARRKTKSRRKVAGPRNFLNLYSGCGGEEQFSIVDDAMGQYRFATQEEAKAAAVRSREMNGYEGGTMLTVQIIDVGKSSGITWGGSLDN